MSQSKKVPPSGRLAVDKSHVCLALTAHLRSLSAIDDNEEVTSFYAVPHGLDIKVEKHD